MQYLVDTNILLRLVQRNDPLNPMIRNAVRKLKNDGNIMLITPQNCAEFWNVATRPSTKNGCKFSCVKTYQVFKYMMRVLLRKYSCFNYSTGHFLSHWKSIDLISEDA